MYEIIELLQKKKNKSMIFLNKLANILSIKFFEIIK